MRADSVRVAILIAYSSGESGGSRNHPSNIIERDRYGGRGVLVWGGIMLGSRTDLQIFDAGSVNGTRYCNEILLPYVHLFRGAMGLQFLFMDDNAPCHRTVAADQLLESIRLAARTLPPVTIRELRLALQDEWAAVPQQLIDTLILSMGRHCETCLASHCAPCCFFNQASFYPSDFSFRAPVPIVTPVSVGNLVGGFGRSASPVDKPQRSTSVSSQDSPTGAPPPPLIEWAVSQQSKLKFTQMFNSYDRTRTGFLTGAQARNILVNTGLSQPILAQIW
ncbi:transposable element Tc3 transposase [Trichonephila clavipes]|nr:transposable element Tc3 transposase [Trichonephila clavipes]